MSSVTMLVYTKLGMVCWRLSKLHGNLWIYKCNFGLLGPLRQAVGLLQTTGTLDGICPQLVAQKLLFAGCFGPCSHGTVSWCMVQELILPIHSTLSAYLCSDSTWTSPAVPLSDQGDSNGMKYAQNCIRLHRNCNSNVLGVRMHRWSKT